MDIYFRNYYDHMRISTLKDYNYIFYDESSEGKWKLNQSLSSRHNSREKRQGKTYVESLCRKLCIGPIYIFLNYTIIQNKILWDLSEI